MEDRRRTLWGRLRHFLAEEDEASVIARDVRTLAEHVQDSLDPYEEEMLHAALVRQAYEEAAERIVFALFAHARPVDAATCELAISVMKRLRPTVDVAALHALATPEPHGEDETRSEYEAMRAAGAEASAIARVAHARGMPRLFRVKLLRGLFGLTLAQAVRLADEAVAP